MNRDSRTKLRLVETSAICLAFAAGFARTWAAALPAKLLPLHLGLQVLFFVLFMAVLLRPLRSPAWMHLYFAIQSTLIVVILSLDPQLDFVTSPFIALCYQAAVLLSGNVRRIWIGIFVLLTAASLMFYYGPLQGLARALVPSVIGIVLAAYVLVNREIEAARDTSQRLLTELEETHRRLEGYIAQIEELAALEERNRLGRELHDSVSQTLFSIALNTRSAQILLERDPSRVRQQLEQLQPLTQSALADMRSVIERLRPRTD